MDLQSILDRTNMTDQWVSKLDESANIDEIPDFSDQEVKGPRKDSIQIQIQSSIRFGVRQKNILYIFNSNFIEVDSDGVLYLSSDKNQLKIEIQGYKILFIHCQINNFIVDNNIIEICYNSPPQYCQNELRKIMKKKIGDRQKVQWLRLENLAFKKVQQQYPQCIFNSYFCIKKGFISLKFKSQSSLRKLLQWIKQALKNIPTQSMSSFKLLGYKDLVNKYSKSAFDSHFLSAQKKQRDKLYIYELKFTLISLLFTCNSIEVQEVFQLAKFIQTLLGDKNIKTIWLVFKVLQPDHVEITMRKEKQISAVKQIVQDSIVRLNLIKQQQRSKKASSILIPQLKITPSGLLPFGWNRNPRNRLMRCYNQFDFLFMNVVLADDSDYKEKQYFKYDQSYQLHLRKTLIRIKYLERHYIPFTWTQSQLKKHTMLFILPHPEIKGVNRAQLLSFLGNFDCINNPALRAARMGQNLSTPCSYIEMQKVTIDLREDQVSADKYLFTDGIGMISKNLVEQIQKKLPKQPTAFQVRIHGSKGMLCLNETLPHNTIVLRKSMKKFQCKNQKARRWLDILEFNHYIEGYINREIIMLLEANGIQVEIFEQILDEYLYMLTSMQEIIEEECFRVKNTSGQQNQFAVENLCEAAGIIKNKRFLNYIKEPTLKGVITQKYRQLVRDIVQKSRIKVQKSARLLGIIDEYNILLEGQIYCTILRPPKYNMEIRENISGRVMITRNPCRHPADIRIVRCVSNQEIKQRFRKNQRPNYFFDFPNTIIFPKVGKIPLTAQISGSDLDGDMFFITWDQRLIPKEQLPPFIVDSTKKVERQWQQDNQDKKMINFFVQFCNNDNLGRIANSHLAKADQEGPFSEDCLQLCQNYYKAVDYPKKGNFVEINLKIQPRDYPHFMDKKEKPSYISANALGRIYDISKAYQKYNFSDQTQTHDKVSYLSAFYPQMNQYSQKQILYGVKVAKEFNQDIKCIMQIYKFERQSQVYILSNKKQDLNLYNFFINLQLKYFSKFFEGLPIGPTRPEFYYDNIRCNPGYSFHDSTKPISHQLVHQRIMLWYHIIYFNILEDIYVLRAWKQKLKQLCPGIQDIKFIGLLWFAIPCLFYIFLKQQSKYEFKEELLLQKFNYSLYVPKKQIQNHKNEILAKQLSSSQSQSSYNSFQFWYEDETLKMRKNRHQYNQRQKILRKKSFKYDYSYKKYSGLLNFYDEDSSQSDYFSEQQSGTKQFKYYRQYISSFEIEKPKKTTVVKKQQKAKDKYQDFRKKAAFQLQQQLLKMFERQSFDSQHVISEVFLSVSCYQQCMKQLLINQILQHLSLTLQKKKEEKEQVKQAEDVNIMGKYENFGQFITFCPTSIDDTVKLNKLLLEGKRVGVARISDIYKENKQFAKLNILCFLTNDQKNKIIKVQANSEEILKCRYFIDLESIISGQRQYEAIQAFRQSPLYKLILNPYEQLSHHQTNKLNNNILQQIKQKRNESQVNCLKTICSSGSGVFLIQGPPGTGKTATILSMIALQYENLKQNKVIQVCSQSNAAIDDICRKIRKEGLIGHPKEKVKLLRIGKLSKKTKDLLRYNYRHQYQKQYFKEVLKLNKKKTTSQLQIKIDKLEEELKNYTSKDEQYDQIKKEIRQIIGEIFDTNSLLDKYPKKLQIIKAKIFANRWLILSTLNSSGARGIRELLEDRVSCLIIDQACQATQPSTLIPFQTRVNKVVLVGDPQQLQPTVMGKNTQKTKYDRSLFQRLVDAGVAPFLLNTQYRMSPKLSKFSNEKFYKNRLYDGKNQKIPQSLAMLPQNRRLCFFDISHGKEKLVYKSYKNQEEASIVALITCCLQTHDSNLTIGIITPYSAQTNLIIQKINSKSIQMQKIKISTVDAFQGQQRDVIIMTCVRANNNGQVGFLKDQKRLNVSITRAKHLLIVVGNVKTLQQDQLWKSYINFHKENGSLHHFQTTKEARQTVSQKFLNKIIKIENHESDEIIESSEEEQRPIKEQKKIQQQVQLKKNYTSEAEQFPKLIQQPQIQKAPQIIKTSKRQSKKAKWQKVPIQCLKIKSGIGR